MSLLDDAIDALLQQKLWLEENWTRLEGGCNSDADRAALIGSYVRARDQWNDAETKNLVMNDAELSGYIKQLGEVRKQLEDDMAALAEISDVLNNIAKGIEAGSKIVRLLA
jgi:hypothetical protein